MVHSRMVFVMGCHPSQFLEEMKAAARSFLGPSSQDQIALFMKWTIQSVPQSVFKLKREKERERERKKKKEKEYPNVM